MEERDDPKAQKESWSQQQALNKFLHDRIAPCISEQKASLDQRWLQLPYPSPHLAGVWIRNIPPKNQRIAGQLCPHQRW